METIKVSDLMVPLEEYATVSQEATLYEAVLALETAQEELDRSRYHYLHRAILALDRDGRVAGKISQLDVLRALEPKYAELGDTTRLARGGFSLQFLKSMQQRYGLFAQPFTDVCSKAGQLRVKDFMHTPGEGEFVSEDASIGEAIHMLVMGHHQSLLVTRGKDITGILRLTDVFKHVFQTMKACQL